MSEGHARVRTTPRTRAEIQASDGVSQQALAERCNVSLSTVRKWQRRGQVQDLSHCLHRLSTTLTLGQKVVVELRRMRLLPLDDLLVVTRGFINPVVSLSGIDRCLQPAGAANLRVLERDDYAKAAPAVKTFKSYRPDFVHVDSSICRRCPTRRRGATWSSRLTEPRAGSTSAPTPTRAMPTAFASCVA